MLATGSQTAPAYRLNWPLLIGFWGLIAAVFVARAISTAATFPLIADTDDAMRLVVVRDFLAGQNWYDHFQYRLNTPFGAELHWSRLVDLPIAGLILLLRPLAGSSAETITAYAWPLILLFLLLYLSARLTLRLAGPAGLLAALALPALSPAIATEFSPGRLDHHSIQILLTLALIWCSVEALSRPRWAIGAGIAAATAIAIGTEGVPMAAAGILVFAAMWVIRPERAEALRGFGISFGAAALIHLATALPPDRWFGPACDAISIVYAAAAAGVGLAFAILSVLPLAARPLWARLGAIALGGATVLGLIVLFFPECLKGPYAGLDPWLVENWLNRITEAKPLWDSLAAMPHLTIAIALPPLVGLVVAGFRLWRREPAGRAAWFVLGGYLAVAVLVMLVQVRGSRLADVIAIPAGAWLIAAARARYLASRKLVATGALVASWVVFAGTAILLLAAAATLPFRPPGDDTAEAVASKKEACLMPAAFADLAALPPERIMTPIDLGSHLLLFTPHSVVAAPYHRNQQGVRDAFDFFNRPIEEARGILEARGVGLVVICPQMREMRGLADAAPDSFVRLYEENALPHWLIDQSLPAAPLKVYAVIPVPAQP